MKVWNLFSNRHDALRELENSPSSAVYWRIHRGANKEKFHRMEMVNGKRKTFTVDSLPSRDGLTHVVSK
jgi:hypothetical protein